MSLLDHHRQKLLACGLTLDTTMRAGLHSGSEAEVRAVLGYGVGPGLVIPYDETYSRVRIDAPGPDGKRYRSPAKAGNRLYVPPALLPSVLGDSTVTLHVTEGEFKALKAVQDGIPCVALAGVWSWKTRLHSQSLVVADFERVVWAKRRVVIVFDSDLADKPPVAWAEHALCQELRRRGAEVYVLRLPAGPRGDKFGLDDYLVTYGVEEFRRLPMLTLSEADQEAPPFLRMTDLADAYLLRALRPHHRLTFGYPELDAVLRGVAPGEVLQILGRSGVGKTAFGLNLVERMTVAGQIPTLIFSLEMPGVELFERVASLTLGWPGRELEDRARQEDPDVSVRLLEVCQRWQHVVIVERSCTMGQLDGLIEAARAAPLWAEPLRLVVVDYLGLILPRRPGTPYEQTSESAKELKRLAKRHQVALVSLCQVGREGESGGTPITLRSARDSGVVEEAADYLLGIWRPALAEGLDREKQHAQQDVFKVRVLKNRSGHAPKTVALHWDGTALRIRPLVDAVAAAWVTDEP